VWKATVAIDVPQLICGVVIMITTGTINVVVLVSVAQSIFVLLAVSLLAFGRPVRNDVDDGDERKVAAVDKSSHASVVDVRSA